MKKLHPLLLLLMLGCALWLSHAARAADEAAATTEERQRALASLLEAARRARDSGEAAEAARLLNRAGRLQLKLNLPQDALATYGDASALLEKSPDPEPAVDSLNGLAAAYNHLSKCGKARPFLDRAVALSERGGYAAGKAAALLTLSDCQNYKNPALALKTARESLALFESAGDRRGVADASNAVGDYELAQNNLTEAADAYRAALGIWRELGAADGQAEALISLGFVEYRRGEWQEVFTYLTQAQGMLDEKAEPYKMGRINAALAEAFIETGMPEVGLDKYTLALDYYRLTRNPRAEIAVAWGIGKTQYILGRHAEAAESLRRALADAESVGESKVAAMCHDFLGRTYAAAGDGEAAMRHFGVALDLYAKLSCRREAARVRALMGLVYEQRGEAVRARRQYGEALAVFRALSDRVNESATLYAMGRLELGRGDLAAAEDLLRRSIEATENVRRVSTSRDLMAAFSATVHERYQAYAECLMRRHAADPARGFDARAFEASEASRARSLAELLRATETSLVPGLDPPLAERERALRQSLRVKEDERVTMLGGAYDRGALDALDAETARLSSEYGRVVEEIRARHPAFGQLARGDAWDLPRLRERVVADDETVLLEYSLGPERGYVWALTRGGLEGYELPGREAVERAAGEVYARLAAAPRPGAPADGGLEAAARELSRMVLAPAAHSLEGRTRVVVVADGALEYVPFQLLPDPADAGEPLVAGREVVNAPSASILGQLGEEAARRRAPARTLAAFGDPVFASNYAARKGGGAAETAALARAEAEGWRNSLRDVRVEGDSFDPSSVRSLFYSGLELSYLSEAVAGADVASGFDATRERLQSTDLSGYAILHFATHGLLDPARPERSGLLLSTVDREGRAREGLLSLRDIYSLRAPVGLVVLSACRTALGKEVRGEGLIGLTRGFMYAGASGVVSSLWRVEDEATAELMRRFYKNMLGRGMTPAAALRDAQNSIRQEPQWRSPHYWAAFTLQGDYRQVVAPTAAAPPPTRYAKALAAATLATLATLAALLFAASRLRKRRAPRPVS
jgi:CHAT domain-containing protein